MTKELYWTVYTNILVHSHVYVKIVTY